jgi:hypothetical protein
MWCLVTGVVMVGISNFTIIAFQVVGLLFADDLAVGATTIIGLQRAVNCVKDFCEEWGLKNKCR